MSTEYVSGRFTKVYKYSKLIELSMCNKSVEVADGEEKIQEYWEQVLKKNDAFFNGEVLNINRIEKCKKGVRIHLCMTDYAHLTYAMNHEQENNTGCKSIASGGLLLTKDNYVILGKMGKKTAFPDVIQCIGGGVSREDLFGQEATFNTFIRECYEEIGIRIGDKSIKEPYKYIYIRNNMTTLGVCYVVDISLYKEEVISIFKDFYKKDNEISELIFCKNDICDIKEFCKRDRLVDYLKPVLQDYVGLNKVTEFEEYKI